MTPATTALIYGTHDGCGGTVYVIETPVRGWLACVKCGQRGDKGYPFMATPTPEVSKRIRAREVALWREKNETANDGAQRRHDEG